ncbi:MAG TPA: CIA30 family protein [Candidatus Sulfomarinibacteraceae bacterium]|nr:CIA30 family protein [Candidatus Sulfomarinibacteraceae bacterium]
MNEHRKPRRPVRVRRRFTRKIVVPVLLLTLLLAGITIVPALRFCPLENRNPLPGSYSKGAFHVHSVFSDGRGDLEEITASAAAVGLDFVVLTDHGTPNRRSSSATGRLNGVLVVGGSELTLEHAHLAAAGFPTPGYRFPPEPQQSIDEVRRGGGVSFIAHPFFRWNGWTDWSVEGHTGIELINAHTLGSKGRLASAALVPRYFVRPAYAMLTTLEYPEDTVAAWEAMNRRGRYSGIFALDAHARLSVGLGKTVHAPTYAEAFALLNVYVKQGGALGDDATSAPACLVAALRAGSFFNCIEAIAPCNGFDAVFEADDGRLLEMGAASAEHAGRLVISLPVDFATDVVVRRDGEAFRRFERNTDGVLEVPITTPGVYRVEVFAADSPFDELPWIMGNPFFLVERQPRTAPPPPIVRQVLAQGGDFFQLECGQPSECSAVPAAGDGSPVTAMRYALPEDPAVGDFSAALANRAPRSFEGFEGLSVRVRADERARYWLMFRTGGGRDEIWYRHSFAADREWATVAVPFEEFRVHHGERLPPDLDAVSSVFVSIDNQIAYPGASGTLFISDLGLF